LIEEKGTIGFFEIQDGEYIQIFQVENDIITDRVQMNRKVALELAYEIIEILGD
jgi:hypothetical protein